MTNTRLSKSTEKLLNSFRKLAQKRVPAFPKYASKNDLIGFALFLAHDGELDGKHKPKL